MIQYTINYLKERKIPFGLSLLFLGLLVIPFWKSNTFEIYDAPGHISLVWYIKEFLWPQFSGWNPFFLSGFPQGVFYPSLFHWVAATLGFFTGIDTAVKLLVSLSIVALPFSVFYVVKNTVRDVKYQLPTTFLIVLFLALLPNFLGVGFRGLFQIGLIPNFVSIVFFFIFVGLLNSELKKGKILWISLVFSILILTHLVTAIAAGLLLITYLKVSWFKSNRDLKFKPLLWFVVITAALTSFFWLPFLLNFSLTSTSAHVASYFSANIILAAVAVVLVWFAFRNRSRESLALSAFALFLLVVAIIDSWLIRSNSQSVIFDFLYSLHVYRFQPYAYLALILAAGALLPKTPLQLSEGMWRGATAALFLILLVHLVVRSPVVTESNLTLEDTQLGGRFIESFRRTESDPLLYTAQTNLVVQNPEENPWVYGLFTDSSPNGPYLGSLVRSLRPEAYPEGEGRFVETKTVDILNIQLGLDIFGIKYQLDLDGVGQEIGEWEVSGKTQTYTAEEVGKGTLVEVLPLSPEAGAPDFDKRVEEWWTQEEGWTTLPVEVDNLETYDVNPETKVEIVSHNEDWTKIKLNIDSQAPQPVLVKFSYFPWWSATQDGQEVQIYRAAPNQMLIIANGEVDLEFKEPVWLNFLYLISMTTLLGLVYLLVKRKM